MYTIYLIWDSIATTMITPTEKQGSLGKALGIEALYFKREDLHPYGSHKGRSIPVMIDHYIKEGERRFALSSSGNAALAAALHVQKINQGATKADVSLEIYVGPHADPHKVAKLKECSSSEIRIMGKERPLQALTQAVKQGVRSLRQSQDEIALKGYKALAQELEEVPNLGAIIIGTSSGTTAQALASYFTKHKLPVQIHIIQTSSCHPMSAAFEPYSGPHEQSIAGAIVDTVAFRKPVLIPLIEESGGRGWTVTNEEITAAQELVKKHSGLEISTNSALSVAGLMQATTVGWDFKGSVVCMICGE